MDTQLTIHDPYKHVGYLIARCLAARIEVNSIRASIKIRYRVPDFLLNYLLMYTLILVVEPRDSQLWVYGSQHILLTDLHLPAV